MTAPVLDPELTAVILRSAADRITEVGLWQGRVSPDEPDTGRTCAALAICAAAGRNGVRGDAQYATLALFARSVGLTIEPDGEFNGEFNAVLDWNDQLAGPNPAGQVVAALHRAADSVLAVAS